MAGSYRPRPTEVKTCTHCGTSFETRHKRAIYCGSSCRVLAFNARQGIESDKTRRAKGNLAFSAQNVGVVTVGAGLAAVGNYVFNDQPARKEILDRLSALDKGFELGINQMLSVAQQQLYFMNAMKKAVPGLESYMDQEQKKGQLEAVKRQEIQTLGKTLLAIRKAK